VPSLGGPVGSSSLWWDTCPAACWLTELAISLGPRPPMTTPSDSTSFRNIISEPERQGELSGHLGAAPEKSH
jgi:hypothetical protein